MQQRSTLRNRVIESTAKTCGVAVRTVYSRCRPGKKNHGIPYSDTDLKMDLMAKVTAAQPSAVYLTDVEAEAHVHECVHFLVAHCELNTIELAWANVEEYVRKHIQQFTMAEVEHLTPTVSLHQTFGHITL